MLTALKRLDRAHLHVLQRRPDRRLPFRLPRLRQEFGQQYPLCPKRRHDANIGEPHGDILLQPEWITRSASRGLLALRLAAIAR